jgi:hypothetical protein
MVSSQDHLNGYGFSISKDKHRQHEIFDGEGEKIANYPLDVHQPGFAPKQGAGKQATLALKQAWHGIPSAQQQWADDRTRAKRQPPQRYSWLRDLAHRSLLI